MKLHQILINDNKSQPQGFVLEQMEKLKALYFDCDYILHTQDEIRKFLKNNFEKNVLQAFDDLTAFAQKADLAKMCLIYVYGGYYFDLAICPSKRVELSEHELVLVKGNAHDIHTLGLPVIENNFLFSKEPKHPLIKKIIDKIVKNVGDLNFGVHPLDITAPIAIGRVIESNSIEKYNITWCYVKMYENDNKYVTYCDEHFYDFKPNKYNADVSKIGVSGSNNYSEIWFSGNSFKVRISYIFITHNPEDKTKQSIESICISSILKNMNDEDELIIVGNVEHLFYLENLSSKVKLFCQSEDAKNKKISKLRNFGVKMSSGNVVVNLDNDVLLSNTFGKNLLNYIRKNKDFDTLNTRILLPNGGRCWDRAVYKTNSTFEDVLKNLIMVDYDYSGENCWYNGPILIRKKTIALEFPYDESINYNECEEIELSMRLVNNGYRIKIDSNNLVFHFDYTLNHVITNEVQRVIRGKPSKDDKIVKDPEAQSLFIKTLKENQKLI